MRCSLSTCLFYLVALAVVIMEPSSSWAGPGNVASRPLFEFVVSCCDRYGTFCMEDTFLALSQPTLYLSLSLSNTRTHTHTHTHTLHLSSKQRKRSPFNRRVIWSVCSCCIAMFILYAIQNHFLFLIYGQ